MARLIDRLFLGLALFVTICLQAATGLQANADDSPTDAGKQQTQASERGPGIELNRWLVLGPISLADGDQPPTSSAAQEDGLETDLLKASGGETELQPDEGDTVKLGKQSLQWQAVDAPDPTIDLDVVLGKKEWSVAYAHTEFESPDAGPALLGVGSDDAVRVWLNGKLVHSLWTGRAVSLDEDLVPVELQQGTNQLLLKVVNQSLGWGFACRFLAADQLPDRLAKAAFQADHATVELLLEHGVDPNAELRMGVTAIQLAKIRGDTKLAEILLDAGAEQRPDPDPIQLAEGMFREERLNKLPGAAVLVARDGKVIYRRVVGLADLETSRPITANTKFRIGSVTKQFTAAAILKLVEQGKLSLTDTLDKFLPDFPRGDEVTIHQLLNHTSGIPSYTDDPNFFATVTKPTSEEDLIATFAGKEFSFEPGSQFHYNNSGYFLLGHLVGKITGQPLGEYLQTTFFAPLGMHDTGMHQHGQDLADEARGYSFQDGEAELALDWDMSRAGGAGQLYSTVEDLMKWNEAVFNGRVLQPESLKLAFTPVEPADAAMKYGYGWTIGEQRGLTTISHGGGLHGFVSHLVRIPSLNLTVVALHNASTPVPALSPASLTAQLTELFAWDKMQPRATREEDPDVDPAGFERFVGRYDYGAAVMEVTKQDDHLFAQLTGQPKFEIYPASETEFFWKVVEASVEFILDGEGQCTAAKHSQGGNTFTAKKLADTKPTDVSQNKLDELTGVYDYGAGKLTVSREGKRLFAQMTGQPKFEIFAASDSEFAWRVVQAEIEFLRDNDGKVVGAKHSQGGATFDVKKIE